VEYSQRTISAICRKGTAAISAISPPLVKSRWDKRFDLVTGVRARNSETSRDQSLSLLMYEKKGAADEGRRKMERESGGKGRESCK